MYSFIVLGARSPNSRRQQGQPFSPGFWCLPAVLSVSSLITAWPSLWLHHHMAVCPLHMAFSPLYVSVSVCFSYKDTGHTRLRTQYTPIWPHLNLYLDYICKDPVSRWDHCCVPVLRKWKVVGLGLQHGFWGYTNSIPNTDSRDLQTDSLVAFYSPLNTLGPPLQRRKWYKYTGFGVVPYRATAEQDTEHSSLTLTFKRWLVWS